MFRITSRLLVSTALFVAGVALLVLSRMGGGAMLTAERVVEAKAEEPVIEERVTLPLFLASEEEPPPPPPPKPKKTIETFSLFTSEPELILEVTRGGVQRTEAGVLKLTYSGAPPARCPT